MCVFFSSFVSPIERKYNSSMAEKDSTGKQLPVGETLENTAPGAANKGRYAACHQSAPEDFPIHVRVIWVELEVIVALAILIFMCWKRNYRIINALYTKGADTTANNTLKERQVSAYSLKRSSTEKQS